MRSICPRYRDRGPGVVPPLTRTAASFVESHGAGAATPATSGAVTANIYPVLISANVPIQTPGVYP